MSSISSMSSASSAWAAQSTQRSQHQAKMFAKVDTDSSGGVDQTELASLLTDISKKTGASLGDSKELFTKMDSNADGSLSSDELAKGMQALMPPPPSTMDFAQSRGAQSGPQGGDGDGDQDDLFSKVDTNSDGSVDAAELKVLTDKIKSDTGQDVSAQFSKLDTDSDGKLSKTEFEAGKPQGPQGAGGGPQGTDGPGGPPPAGGPGGAGGASGAQSASSTTYDPLDTNQDGTVSELERLVGELTKASSSAGSSDQATSTAAKFDIATLAKQIYAQVADGLTNQSGSLLSTTA
ncbi:MAG: hypothetical protein RL302_76 [Pseudomonadota bacterium]|jgi:Ca2+-binding EF-hand superfamily protein